MFIIISVLILTSLVRLDFEKTFLLSYIFLTFVILFIWKSADTKNFGIGAMSLYYLVIVSFGYPLGFLINPEYTITKLTSYKLLYGIYFDKYMALSIISLSAFIIGSVVKLSKNNRIPKEQCNEENINNNKVSVNYYYQIGFILICIYAIYMGINWILGTVPTEYLLYKEWSGNQVHNYLKMLFWFGAIFVMVSGTKKQIFITSIIFLIPALILLATGNRNDVLYPIIISIGIYVHRYGEIPRKLLIFVGIFLFFISPIIASTRSTGIVLKTEYSLTELLTDSILEMGSQIASVSNMFSWIENGEAFALGGTYFFATAALFLGFINPQIRQQYFTSRFSIETRLPAIAFTMPGELYYNFTFVGVIIVYIMIGAYIRKKDNSFMTDDKLVQYSFYSLMLLHWVRNQFYFSATYIFIFYLLYYFEKLIVRSFFTRKLNER